MQNTLGVPLPYARMQELADGEVGVREHGGQNMGTRVQQYQMALDGRANGEPWCAAFLAWCVINAGTGTEYDGKHGLILSEHVMTMWNTTPASHRVARPVAYGWFVWRKIGTAMGHCGFVEALSADGKHMLTIEGNTSSGSGSIREGDGVYRRKRPVGGARGFVAVGCLTPFRGAVHNPREPSRSAPRRV